MITFLRFYLPLYLVLYLLVSFLVPTYKTYRQTGINPVTFGKSDSAHDYIGGVMKILIGLLLAAVLLFSFGSDAYLFTSPVLFLEHSYLQLTGLVLIHVSLIWIAIAQYQMSTSWRIGIDETHKTTLRTNGLFSISRNPIFLGMIISVFGLFLILPNAITFFCTLMTYFMIQIQVRLEEVFLTQQHALEYSLYKQKVRRFL
ncbi:methyltransferase family protein [Flavobacterium inviolabile]|uniref:methyltransferase family protein n=1 Tax=Flavobacterium inviolabile TaxID=2748320 RepID=UPI0015AAB3B4|nr:isoprenylcysteine carboxylmethyltransferase family protein [Flavobacterium inviolabile]